MHDTSACFTLCSFDPIYAFVLAQHYGKRFYLTNDLL